MSTITITFGGCEKCWSDAYMRWLGNSESTQAEHYGDLLDERRDNPCTAEQQRGESR